MATEAQRRARNKWNAEHKEKAQVYRYRSQAKKFIKEFASSKDISELRALLDKREKELKED